MHSSHDTKEAVKGFRAHTFVYKNHFQCICIEALRGVARSHQIAHERQKGLGNLRDEESHDGGMFSDLIVLRRAGAERRSAGADRQLERLHRRPSRHSADGLEFLERLRWHG